MTRNIENRIEVATPIYDTSLQKEIIDVFEIIWNDNIKARKINQDSQNEFVRNDKKSIRSQFEIFEYYRNKSCS